MTPRAEPLPPEERRASILRAARPLLLEHGGHFTTRQVAEAAGIAEGTLFRVFPTKRDLMHAVIADAMDSTPICDDLARIDPALPLEQRIAAALTRMQRSISDVSAIFGALFQMPTDEVKGLRPEPPGDADDPHSRRQRQADMLQRAMEQVLGPDRDRLHCSVGEAASLLRSVAFATAHPHLTDHRLTDPHRLAELLLHGLASPSTSQRTDSPC